jgi:hypothetical protein
MPRRRPSILRAQVWANRRRYRPAPKIPGVSSRTRAAIARIEFQRLWPGAVAEAFADYKRFLRQPGRYLYLPEDDCPCCDPAEARNTLEYALRRLRSPAKAELLRIVTRLDEELYRRTLPDPWARYYPWRFGGWWHQRIHEK